MVGKQGRGQHISRSFLLFPPTDIIFIVWLYWNVLKFVSIITICQSSVSTMIMDFMDMKTLYSCPLSWGFWEFHNCIVYKLSRLGGGADADIWHNTPSRWRARVTSQCPPSGSWLSGGTGGLSPVPCTCPAVTLARAPTCPHQNSSYGRVQTWNNLQQGLSCCGGGGLNLCSLMSTAVLHWLWLFWILIILVNF